MNWFRYIPIRKSKKLISILILGIILILLLSSQNHHQLEQTIFSGKYNIDEIYNVINVTATIDDVLILQRKLISYEMKKSDVNSKFRIDPENLEQPKRSIIISSWRCGSTFLGDILNSVPGNYFHSEPLFHYGVKRFRDNTSESDEAISDLKFLLNCNYNKINKNYLDYGKTQSEFFFKNFRLWKMCKLFPNLCWELNFLTQFCKLFPFQSMKVTRLSLALAENLLEDVTLNVSVILLVRDPRGIVQSRNHCIFCIENPYCGYSQILCEDLVSDYNIAKHLFNIYPDRFRTLRYEDLCLNVYEMSKEILQFLGLSFDPKVKEFLDTHTKYDSGGAYSTFRDTKRTPFHWIKDLTWEEVDNIQNNCTKAMKLWGYKKVANLNGLTTTDTIILPTKFNKD